MINIIQKFLDSLFRTPDHIALEINNDLYTYNELWRYSSRLSNIIKKASEQTYSKTVGIMAYRSFYVYASILATLKAGCTYIPFNPKFPIERMLRMIKISGCHILIITSDFQKALPELIELIPDDVLIINAWLEDDIKSSKIQFSSKQILNAIPDELITEVDPDFPVYILFTSGTTGEPKGIPISHSNLRSYIDFVQDKYPIQQDDRCSQAFDTTFDPSEHDIWTAWNAGATLVSVPAQDLLSPAKFIQKKSLSVWYSVPSIASFMRTTRTLREGIFPLLRYSIFSGEALPADLADEWQKAAPNSVLINYYGPTEVTINITDYVWKGRESLRESLNNIVPLGPIFRTHRYQIVDKNLQPVLFGKEGELIIAGPQVSKGYVNNPQKTSEMFIKIKDDPEIWYKTGDLVKENTNGCIFYLGRTDDQVKIRGFRVELQEIESVIKNITCSEVVIAAPHPIKNNIAEGIVCFILGNETISNSSLLHEAGKKLPEYMIPKRILYLKEIPYSINGKVDKKKLVELYLNK